MNQLAIFTATKTGVLFELSVLVFALAIHTYKTERQFNRKNIRRMLVTLAAAGTFRIIGELIKAGVAEPRPCWDPNALSLMRCPDSFSFPSGHALGAMMVAVLLGLVIRNRVILTIGVLLALLIAWSRVAVGVHTLWDVSAGSMMGVAFGWFVWRIYWYVH